MTFKDWVKTLPEGTYSGTQIIKQWDELRKKERTEYRKEWFQKKYIKVEDLKKEEPTD